MIAHRRFARLTASISYLAALGVGVGLYLKMSGRLAIIGAPLVIFITEASAQAAPAPSAAEVLQMVRYSQSATEQDFEGAIRDRRVSLKAIPMNLTMSEREVRFSFYKGDKRKVDNEDQILILSMLNNRYKLEEIRGGKRQDLAADRFAERVRGTDITYEDLAMRFLYWPNPKHMGESRAKGGMAWKIRCTNPLAEGAYAIVDVWVSQKSGALVKMNAFNKAGAHVKSFVVDDIQQAPGGGGWVLKKMIVRTHKGKDITSTYLSLDRPK